MRRWLILASGLLLAAVVAAGVSWWWLNNWLDNPVVVSPAEVEFAPGEPFATFARRLAEDGVVERSWPLVLAARLGGQAVRMKAGEYRLELSMTGRQILAALEDGNVIQRELRITDGQSIAQMLAVVAAAPKLTLTLGTGSNAPDGDTLMVQLGLPRGHAEGWFFPDTYRYIAGDSDVDVLLRAHERMRAVLERTWSERAPDLPYATPYELLIAASLVEKETGRDEDRTMISQVFASRLAQGMRLQTDPSVIYGLGDTFDGNLTRAHLRRDSPYNSYTRHGLPPSPIALPGQRALTAAAHPADTDYLYFVARGDGRSQFSKTLREHNAAVRRYQLRRR